MMKRAQRVGTSFRAGELVDEGRHIHQPLDMPKALVTGPTTIAMFDNGEPTKIAVNTKFVIDGILDEGSRNWMVGATMSFDKRGSNRPTDNLAQLMAILLAIQQVRLNAKRTPAQSLVEIMSAGFQAEKLRSEVQAQAVILPSDKTNKTDTAPPPPSRLSRTGDPKRVIRTSEPISDMQTGEIFVGQNGAAAIVGLNDRWAALTCQAPYVPFFRIDPIEHFVDLREFVCGGSPPYVRTHREAFPDSGFLPEIIRQATATA